MRSEEIEAAKKYYQNALDINPSADAIQSNLGSLYLQAGQILEAHKAFLLATGRNDRNYKAHIGLGCCLITLKKQEEAFQEFKKALEIELRNPTGIYYLVKCAYELKKYQETEMILKNYIEVAPINANLLYCLAGIQFHLKKLQEAEETVEAILDIKPGHNGAIELKKRISQG